MPAGTRAERLFLQLVRRLAAGHWKPGQTLPPTRRLEREFGVSHLTILAVLRRAASHRLVEVRQRRPVLVLPGAAQRAADLLAELSKRSDLRRLAILVPDFVWPWKETIFFNDLIPAVIAEAEKRNIRAEPVRWPLLEQVDFVRDFAGRGFGAAFAAAVRAEYIVSLHVLRQQRFPVVVFNCDLPQVPLPTVSIDEYGGASKVASHLAALGHRNMCMVSMAFDLRLKSHRHRVDGWLDFLKEADLLRSCVMPVCYATPREDVLEHFGRIFHGPGRPTAVVFAYGYLCMRFLQNTAHSRMRIPEQVSLATFDALRRLARPPWCPPMTTVSCDMPRTAQCVMEMVEKLLAGNLQPRNIRVPMAVALTESIGPPPAGTKGPGDM